MTDSRDADFEDLRDKAIATYEAMGTEGETVQVIVPTAVFKGLSPEERAKHDAAQRESFASGNNWGDEGTRCVRVEHRTVGLDDRLILNDDSGEVVLHGKGPGVRVIYIAGPFRGPNAWEVEQNIRRAEDLAYRVAELGAMPLCPHTNTRCFDGTLTPRFWLDGTMELMRRCDAVIFTVDWERSQGARGERAEAQRIGLPVFYDLASLERWLAALS